MHLRWRRPDGTGGDHSSTKKVITIGAHPANDIAVSGAGLEQHHAHILTRKGGLQVSSLGGHALKVNDLPVAQAQLVVGDRLTAADLEITLLAMAATPAPPTETNAEDILRRLDWFGQNLADVSDPARILEVLLDLLISVLEVEKGLILTGPAGQLSVQTARGLDGAAAEAELRQLPDRLLAQVYADGQPLATIDAGQDETFVGSTTVLRLGLRAVMVLPLKVAGAVRGVLVLASQRPSPLFRPEGLREAALYSVLASLLVDQILRSKALAVDLEGARSEIADLKLPGVVYASDEMSRIAKLIERVAPSDLSVLITGETGTGKELVAREIHTRSLSPDAPFVAINCGAIPEGLIESELFGHVKGAFSGAHADRMGKIEAASGGTLFLDEIGDMPASVQVRLLRTVQERMVTPVGQSEARPVSFRLISATHCNLEEGIRKGTFRTDLYYRIREVELCLPALRDRAADILLLAHHFIKRCARHYGVPAPRLSPEAQSALLSHGWPGNIRELEGRIKRAVVMAEQDEIRPEHLELKSQTAPAPGPPLNLEEAVMQYRDQMVQRALTECAGNRKKAAATLGVDPRTLYRYLVKKPNDGD